MRTEGITEGTVHFEADGKIPAETIDAIVAFMMSQEGISVVRSW